MKYEDGLSIQERLNWFGVGELRQLPAMYNSIAIKGFIEEIETAKAFFTQNDANFYDAYITNFIEWTKTLDGYDEEIS